MGKNEIVKQLAERIDGNITEETMRKYSEVCDTLVDIFTDALIEIKLNYFPQQKLLGVR